MGIEQYSLQENTAAAVCQPFNFVDLAMSDSSLSAPWAGANFSRRQETGGDDDPHVLDFSVAIEAPKQRALLDRSDTGAVSAAIVARSEIALPADKYEAEVARQIGYLDSEANFSQHTKEALGRDCDKYLPERNEDAGTTTYTIEQFGLTDRGLPNQGHQAEHYKRLVTITVPDQASSLKDCTFSYQDREKVDEKEFFQLIDRARTRQSDQTEDAADENKIDRAKDLVLYTHGIRTGAEGADFQALALQLTHGHCVINVDWQSTPASEERQSLSEAYKSERKGAAQSYARFEKVLDDTINHIGAQYTDMIAFSHGAMFDTRYLQHRKDSHAPLLQGVIFSHPDVPNSALPQVDKNGKVDTSNRLYSQAAKHTHVIGSTEDMALMGAAYIDAESNASHSWMAQLLEKRSNMPLHERIGNGKTISRELVAGHGGTYVIENIPKDKTDPTLHFINYQNINTLINGHRRPTLIASGDHTTSKTPVGVTIGP